MTFLWPNMLWLLLAVPAAIALYIIVLRRKKRGAVRYASLGLMKEALGPGQRVRRHVPPLLFLFSLTLMLVAIARPAAVVTLPSHHETIILAIDVSGSMRAEDVQPNRLVAAQNAAKAFIKDQPSNVRIGIVSFAGTAAVVQAPTENRDDLIAAIDRFQLQRGTAVGSGIIVSLATLFPEAGIEIGDPAFTRGSSRRGGGRGKPLSESGTEDGKAAFKPVAPGSHTSAAIILLTDGQTTTGPDPLDAARMAADRGVRVFTVGIGTPEGEVMGFEGWRMRVRLDEDALKAISNLTRGEYFYAGSAPDLRKIYDGLNARFVLEKKPSEVTALFSAAAAVAALLSALLSLLWFHRVF
ncbi:MAG: VWA domain-containing protein [Rhodospirillaceae bacterium]